MIRINFIDNIILVNSDMKTPIMTKKSSSYGFYSSMELLTASVGVCTAGNIQKFCLFNQINVKLFDDLILTMDNFQITIEIYYHKSISIETINNLLLELSQCEIAKLLINPPIIKTFTFDTPIEEVIRKENSPRCCGS